MLVQQLVYPLEQGIEGGKGASHLFQLLLVVREKLSGAWSGMCKQLTQQPADLPQAGAGQQGLLQDSKQGIHQLPRGCCIFLALPGVLHAALPCMALGWLLRVMDYLLVLLLLVGGSIG